MLFRISGFKKKNMKSFTMRRLKEVEIEKIKLKMKAKLKSMISKPS